MAVNWLDVETTQAENSAMSALVCRHSSWAADFPWYTEGNKINMITKFLNQGAKGRLQAYLETKNKTPYLDADLGP